MIDINRLFRVFFDVVKDDVYKVVIAIVILLTVGMMWLVARRWERTIGTRLIHGFHIGHRLVIAVGGALIFVGVLWFPVGLFIFVLAVFWVFAWVSYIWLAGLGLIFLIAVISVFRVKRLEIDLEQRTYVLRRGFLFWVRERSGDLDDINHLRLDGTEEREGIKWRINLVWKDGAEVFTIHERRLMKLKLVDKGFLFLTGWLGWAKRTLKSGYEKLDEKLRSYEEKLSLTAEVPHDWQSYLEPV